MPTGHTLAMCCAEASIPPVLRLAASWRVSSRLFISGAQDSRRSDGRGLLLGQPLESCVGVGCGDLGKPSSDLRTIVSRLSAIFSRPSLERATSRHLRSRSRSLTGSGDHGSCPSTAAGKRVSPGAGIGDVPVRRTV